ncbi:ABC transporter substrate-binding protein [Gracilibacillus sp. YIM 98692]|uniref:ABC transporter substrate-binding protein n=1 Tax=Gracilibacillus sp. YIM 98692 TaxID=2663532 RepID=UPI001F099AE6|nr:ABC transporter substrate-binding protein [Gracilibacillus sp. YIM 98692]
MKKMKWLVLTTLLMALMVLVACQEETSGAKEPEEPQNEKEEVKDTGSEADVVEVENKDEIEIGEPEVTDVTLRLNWRFKGEFTPFFVAKQKGIFEKYGLEVEVLEGNGSTNTMQTISQGQDDFGITSTVEPSQGIEQDMPIKMIASYMNRSPIMIASHPDTPVETPKDLEGKRIAMSISSTFTNIFPNFLDSHDVDASQVDAVQVETSARNGVFLNKEVDAVAIFATNEYPIFEQELGVDLTPLYLADFEYDLSGLTMIGNTEFLDQNPNTVKRFLAAIDEAFHYTFENKEESISIVLELFPDATDENTVSSQLDLLEEISVFDNEAYGTMTEQNMNNTLEILESSNLISERADLERYYTNEYLPQ